MSSASNVFANEHDKIVWELLDGNRKYVKWLQEHRNDPNMAEAEKEARLKQANLHQIGYLQQIEEDGLGINNTALRSTRPKALTISCARSFSPMDHIFSTDSRALMSIRVAGYCCSAADSIIGSVEYALEEQAPPVLMVVGNARNDIVCTAVRMVRARRVPPACICVVSPPCTCTPRVKRS